jgi:hypothetical protein
MGYRSEVAALVYPNDDANESAEERYEALKVLMNTQFEAVMDKWGNCIAMHDYRRRLEFVINDVKWYPSYDDVSTFMKFLDDVEELGYSYEFLRLGEDDDDVERRAGGPTCHYHLQIRREIVME